MVCVRQGAPKYISCCVKRRIQLSKDRAAKFGFLRSTHSDIRNDQSTHHALVDLSRRCEGGGGAVVFMHAAKAGSAFVALMRPSELGPRGKFRCIFIAKFTAYCSFSNTVSYRTLSAKVLKLLERKEGGSRTHAVDNWLRYCC